MPLVVRLCRSCTRLARNKSGAVGVEYALLIAFIAIVAATGMTALGGNLQGFLTTIGGGLQVASNDLPPLPGSTGSGGESSGGSGSSSGGGNSGGEAGSGGGAGGTGSGAGGTGSGGGGTSAGGGTGSGTGGSSGGAGTGGDTATAGGSTGAGSGGGGSASTGGTGSGTGGGNANAGGGSSSSGADGAGSGAGTGGSGSAANAGGSGSGTDAGATGNGAGAGSGSGSATGSGSGNSAGTSGGSATAGAGGVGNGASGGGGNGSGPGGPGDQPGPGAPENSPRPDPASGDSAGGVEVATQSSAAGAATAAGSNVARTPPPHMALGPASMPGYDKRAGSAPVVRIVNPSRSATVSGAVEVQIIASDVEDAAGTLTVEVSSDGGATWNRAKPELGTLYTYVWVTPAGTDSLNRQLVARATDSAANTTTSRKVPVLVNNKGTRSLASAAPASND